jgi:pimeloyl-ACP methyl ester carboxylesterase
MNLKSTTKKTFLVVLGIVGFLAVSFQSWKYLYPLEASELSQRWEFWKEGIHSVQLGHLHAYEREFCDIKQKKHCSCVVLIHGLADNALTWKRILMAPQEGWPEQMTLLAVDLPGSGKSPPPNDPQEYQVRKTALKLKQLLAPRCPYWTVVGNSLGGWIAAWLAIEWPEGINKMILLDSAGLKKLQNDSNISSFSEPTVEGLKEFQKKAYYKTKEIPEHVWKAIVDRMKQSNSRDVKGAQIAEDDLEGKLFKVRTPTLVLWGEADQIIPIAVGKTLSAEIPGAIFRTVEKCGHMPQKECPLEVIRAISEMIRLGAM